MRKKAKRKLTAFRVVEMIANILVYPVILTAFVSSFFMLVARSNNTIVPVFGHSFVRILSQSMSDYCEEAQRTFNKGEVIVIDMNKTSYKVGDVIAFYYHHDSVDNEQLFPLTTYESRLVNGLDKDGNIIKDSEGKDVFVENRYYPVKDENGNVIVNEKLNSDIQNAKVGESFTYNNQVYTKTEKSKERSSLDEIRKAKIPVYFHQIVQIKVDSSGTIFYITKGTHNESSDAFAIREDLVVGKFKKTPDMLTAVINFCSSTIGMLVLVVVPITIIVLIELLSVIEQINNILLEKKVINREIPFDTKDCIKANIGLEMREPDKIFYYDILPDEYKLDAYEFLWGCLEKSQNAKQQRVFLTSKSATAEYDEEDVSKYYKIWIESFKSKKMRKEIAQSQVRAEKERYIDVLNKDYQNYRDGEEDEDNFEDTDEVLKKDKLKEKEDKFIEEQNIYYKKTGKKLEKAISNKLDEIEEKESKTKDLLSSNNKVEKNITNKSNDKVKSTKKVLPKKLPPKR